MSPSLYGFMAWLLFYGLEHEYMNWIQELAAFRKLINYLRAWEHSYAHIIVGEAGKLSR